MNPKFTKIQLLFPFFVGTTSEYIKSLPAPQMYKANCGRRKQ